MIKGKLIVSSCDKNVLENQMMHEKLYQMINTTFFKNKYSSQLKILVGLWKSLNL